MKKWLILIFIALLLLLIGIYVFSRDSSLEGVDQNSTTENQEEVLSENEISTFKDPFIQANAEFVCELKANPALESDRETMESRLTEIYRKYNFPVDDHKTMIQILQKYENDEITNSAIKKAGQNC